MYVISVKCLEIQAESTVTASF